MTGREGGGRIAHMHYRIAGVCDPVMQMPDGMGCHGVADCCSVRSCCANARQDGVLQGCRGCHVGCRGVLWDVVETLWGVMGCRVVWLGGGQGVPA
jgi:hypothetical protein